MAATASATQGSRGSESHVGFFLPQESPSAARSLAASRSSKSSLASAPAKSSVSKSPFSAARSAVSAAQTRIEALKKMQAELKAQVQEAKKDLESKIFQYREKIKQLGSTHGLVKCDIESKPPTDKAAADHDVFSFIEMNPSEAFQVSQLESGNESLRKELDAINLSINALDASFAILAVVERHGVKAIKLEFKEKQ